MKQDSKDALRLGLGRVVIVPWLSLHNILPIFSVQDFTSLISQMDKIFSHGFFRSFLTYIL